MGAHSLEYSNKFWTIPNVLTLTRFLATPLIIGLIVNEEWYGALILFSLTILTDSLDGYLARALHQMSRWGLYLDPLADKVLISSVYLTFCYLDILPKALAIIVALRDVLLVSAAVSSLILKHNFTIRPLLISKINTFAQATLIVLILLNYSFEFSRPERVEGLSQLLMIMVGLFTIVSGTLYTIDWVKHLRKYCKRNPHHN